MSDKNQKQEKWFKMRRVLTVICRYEVYKGKNNYHSRCYCTPKHTGSVLCKLC